MALKEKEIEKLSKEFMIIFDKLEDSILIELGKFLKENKSEQARNTIKVLKSLGTSKAKIDKLINETIKQIPTMNERIFKDIAHVSDTREIKEYLKNDYKVLPLEESDIMKRLIQSHIDSANDVIAHYMRSLAFGGTDIQEAFLKATDFVSLQTATGAVTYDQAVATATKDFAKKGLTTIAYTSGAKIDLQSGIRRVVITEGNQMALRMTEERVKESGVKYVEISSHSGARPEHAKWQGRVIKFEDLHRITGYGDVDGLGGANCRHTFHPFFPKSVKAPKEPEPKPKEFNGVEYTLYEAEQKQRYYERNIRRLKREKLVLENAGASTDKVDAQLSDWQKNYREFSNAMDMRKKNERTRIY